MIAHTLAVSENPGMFSSCLVEHLRRVREFPGFSTVGNPAATAVSPFAIVAGLTVKSLSTAGVPKALAPTLVLPIVICSVNTGRPRFGHGRPASAGFPASQRLQRDLDLDRITRLVPLDVRLKPDASVCAFCLDPDCENPHRTYM